MIKQIKGDIFTSIKKTDARHIVICHQVNCLGVMGGGIALTIRDKFPIVYGAYRCKCDLMNNDKNLLGQVQIVETEQRGLYVANCFGQYGIQSGKNTDYGALLKCFSTLNKMYKNTDTIIRIPYKIGCGLGGGDWGIVEKIIREELSECNVEIWRYE